MLPVGRIHQIRDMVQREKSILVADLATAFGVSEETIRRDLKKLESEGVLTRVYGGAYSVEGVQNDVKVHLRQNVLVDEKRIIAERCLRYVNNGDSIFLDCSTTAFALAQILLDYTITVVTNSLKVAQAFSAKSNIKLILIGGTYHDTSMSFLGPAAVQSLNNYYVDKAFISCRSLSLVNGITDSNQDQAFMRKTAISRCNNCYLLADHTKFGATSFYHITDIENVDTIVTDWKLEDTWVQHLREHRVSYIDESRV